MPRRLARLVTASMRSVIGVDLLSRPLAAAAGVRTIVPAATGPTCPAPGTSRPRVGARRADTWGTMPAPRTCRSCGGALASRRCRACGGEATEFAARAPRTKGTVGTEELRVGAIMLTTLLGMYAFFRSFLR